MQQRSRRSGSLQDDDSYNLLASQPGTNEHLQASSQRAQGVIDDIDSLLAQEEAANEADALNNQSAGSSLNEQESGGATSGDAAPDDDDSSDNTESGLYNPEDDDEKNGSGSKKKQKGKGTSKSRKKVAAIMGSGFVGFLVTIASMFLSVLPFKINTVVSALEDRFFGVAQQAEQSVGELLFTSYLRKYVLPGYNGTCTSSRIDRNCTKLPEGTGPVAKLYQTWRQVRMEKKLYDSFGIEFGRTGTGKFYMRTPDVQGDIDLTDVENGKQKNVFDLDAISRSDLRAKYKSQFDSLSFAKKAWWRYKVGKLLEAKYGIKRCLAACNIRDKFSDKVDTKKLAFKAYLIRRVIEPRSQLLGVVFSCLISDCDTEKTSDPNDTATNGEPQDQFDRDTRKTLAAYAARFGSDKLDKIVGNLKQFQEAGGFGNYITGKFIEKITGVFGKEISKEAVSKVTNTAGWVLAALRIIHFIDGAGSAIRHYAYVVNGAAMVAMFTMYQTTANEAKSGHMDPTIYGSMTDGLTKGTAPSGALDSSSPLYQETFSSSKPAVASLVRSLLPAKAYAIPEQDAYRCASGKTIYEEQSDARNNGNRVCGEEKLNLTDNVITEISDFLHGIPGFSFIADVAGFIGDVAETALKPVTDAVSALADITGLSNLIENAIVPMIQSLMSWLIPNPFDQYKDGPNKGEIDGARTTNMVIGGADVAGNDSAHRLLGGKQLTDAELTAILNERQEYQDALFAQRSFFARVFDKENTHSLVSQIALALPGDSTVAAQQSIASLISNPFGKIASTFANIFSTKHTFAADRIQDDAHGITQYGYPVNDKVFTSDPEDYWNKNCKDGKKTAAWNQAAIDNINPNTGVPENTSTNPCLLIQSTAESQTKPYEQ